MLYLNCIFYLQIEMYAINFYKLLMKLISFLIVASILLLTHNKKIEKTIKINDFNSQSHFVFLTKFHIAAGRSDLQLSYEKNQGISSQSFYRDVALGMLSESRYKQFTQKQSCQQRQKLLLKKDKFNLSARHFGTKFIRLFDLYNEDLWYFYIYSCNAKTQEIINNPEQITINFKILNNGSHFGQNQQLLPAYTIIMTAWIGLIFKFMPSLPTFLQFRNPNPKKMVVFGGLIFMAVAYLYQLIHLYIYSNDGSGVHIFHIFYLVLKNLGETAITTMLIAIAWGWSITQARNDKLNTVIGVSSGIINMISFVLSFLAEQNEEIFHHYETTPGLIVLVLRMVIFVIFLLGLRKILCESSGKIVFFIRNFGLIGGIYLWTWPATVLFAEIVLPAYMQRQVITFVEEFVHIIASTILCHMISDPQSTYRKISLQDDDNPLKIKNYKHK